MVLWQAEHPRVLNTSPLHTLLDENTQVHAIYRALGRDLAAPQVQAEFGQSALSLCLDLKNTSTAKSIISAAEDIYRSIDALRILVKSGQAVAGLKNHLSKPIQETVRLLESSQLDWPHRRYLMTYVQIRQLASKAGHLGDIPKTIHFLKTDGDHRHINPINYLSIKSAIHHCPDYRIILHTPKCPEGPLWDELLPYMDIQPGIPPQTLGAHKIQQAAHQADVWRAEKLIEHGGFYFDWDLVLLRPPTELLDNICVMGLEGLVPQHSEVLGVSAIGAQPGSPFLQCWLNGMAHAFDPDQYVTHSTVLAHQIALAFPASVRVLPSNSFYFPGWTAEAMAWLFDPAQRLDPAQLNAALNHSWGIHLFESHKNFLHYTDGLSLETLRDMNCNFSNIIRPLLT